MSTVLNRHFARHYVEMVVVMFLGMAVLWIPAGWALGAVGSSWTELQDQAPAAMLLLMAATMTLPMAAWMRRRGHGWGPTNEMSASMIVPTLGVIALHGVGLMSDVDTMLIVEHVLMLAGMFGAMLLRPEEYSHHHQHAVMA